MNGLIFGRRRQGKSTLSLALAITRKDTVIVFDPNCNFKRWPVVTSADRLEAMLDSSDESLMILVWRPDPGDIEASFSEMFEVLHQFEDYVLVIDEASELQRAQGMAPALATLLRQHPDSVDVFQSTHRVVDVHPLSRSLATDWFFFQSTSQKDLELIVQATEVPELAEEIPKLDRWQVIHYWLGPGGTREWAKHTNSKDWFIDMDGESENPTPAPEPATAPATHPAPEPGAPASAPKVTIDDVMREVRKVKGRVAKLAKSQRQAAPTPEAEPEPQSTPNPQPEPAKPVANSSRHRTILERAVMGR